MDQLSTRVHGYSLATQPVADGAPPQQGFSMYAMWLESGRAAPRRQGSPCIPYSRGNWACRGCHSMPAQPGGLGVRAPNDLEDPLLLHDDHDRSCHPMLMPSRPSLTLPGAPGVSGRKAAQGLPNSALPLRCYHPHTRRLPPTVASLASDLALSRQGRCSKQPVCLPRPHVSFALQRGARLSVDRMPALPHFSWTAGFQPPGIISPAKRPRGRS